MGRATGLKMIHKIRDWKKKPKVKEKDDEEKWNSTEERKLRVDYIDSLMI